MGVVFVSVFVYVCVCGVVWCGVVWCGGHLLRAASYKTISVKRILCAK